MSNLRQWPERIGAGLGLGDPSAISESALRVTAGSRFKVQAAMWPAAAVAQAGGLDSASVVPVHDSDGSNNDAKPPPCT